jgi:hypothetical protein
VGGALALWFIVEVFRNFSGGLKSRDPLFRGLALGGAAGIFGILVHSLFDFNLQLPSNALMFLVLSALLASVRGGLSKRDHVGASPRAQEGSASLAAGTT